MTTHGVMTANPMGGSGTQPFPDGSEFEGIELILKPSTGWRFVDFGELVRARDLLYFLTWRGIKARYAQSALGVGWAVLQPVVSTLIFTVVFGRLAKISSDGLPYVLFAFCGMVLWTFFSNALTEGSNSLVRNSHMISKVYFPRMILPISAISSKLLDLSIGFVMLGVMLVVFGMVPGAGVVMVPVLLGVLMVTVVGLSLWLSAMAVQYRDVAYGLNFAIQLLMYLSPVVYPASLIPDRFRLIYGLNPMCGIIEGFRSALLGHPTMPWDLIAVGSMVAVVLFVTGCVYFRHMERIFADVV